MNAPLGPIADALAIAAVHEARARQERNAAETADRIASRAVTDALAETLAEAHAVVVVTEDADGHLNRRFAFSIAAADRAARRARARGEAAAVVLVTLTPTVSYQPADERQSDGRSPR
jgi:hypothetical protein